MNTILQQRIEEAAANHKAYAEEFRLKSDTSFICGVDWYINHQWISVDEAFPDDDENVLLIFDDGHIIVAYHSGNYWWWCDGFVCGTKTNGQPMYSSSQRIDDKPTHWMHIPSLEGGEK